MKYKELTTKSEAEVLKLLEDLQFEQSSLSQKIHLKQEKRTHKLGVIKKDIARIMTFLSNK